MRMWKVDPEKMCRKHLLGEHVEMHMFAGTLAKGKSIKGYLANGLVEVASIRSRHDALVNEMTKRGYKHIKELPEFTTTLTLYSSGYVDIEANEKELARRCKDCKF